MPLVFRFIPLLVLSAAGCTSEENLSEFCAATGRHDVAHPVRIDKANLYILGNYMHGAEALDESCPSNMTTVLLDYESPEHPPPAMKKTDDFWVDFFVSPKLKGGMYRVIAEAEVRPVGGEERVHIGQVYAYSEVSVEEAKRIRELIAGARKAAGTKEP